MAPLLGLLITAQLSMSQSTNVMTINMPASNNWVIGTTLDGMLNSGPPSPFTTQSIQDFEDAWEAKDEWLQQGAFTMTTNIVTSQEDAVEAMGVSGSLEFSYLMFSGDAHLKFTKENIQSSSDVSVIIKASAAGRKQQMSLAETNMLELKDTIAVNDIEDFTSIYGAYLIVGFEYGGEILFQSTHSAKSSEDKMAIEGGLSLSFASAGFDIAGSADVNYEKSDISKSVDDSKKWSIRPNTWGSDATSLISSLSSIATGGMADDDTLYESLALSAQSLLSADDAEPIKAIVISLSSVSAVSDLLVNNAESEDTIPFVSFLNELYMAVEGLAKQLKLVESEWRRQSPETTDDLTWGDWEHCLNSLSEQMQVINNIHDIIENSNAYLASDTHWNSDVMTAESFIEVTVSGLNLQFEAAIMNPYNAMLASLTTTTTSPTTTSFPTIAPTEVATFEHIGCYVDTMYRALPFGPSSVYAVEHDGNPESGCNCLPECHADCDSDSDCIGPLLCYHRNGWDDAVPPGCSGDAHYELSDYCYDPTKAAGGWVPETCQTACFGYQYFALQDGGECFCGKSFADATQYGESSVCSAGLGAGFTNDLYENLLYPNLVSGASAAKRIAAVTDEATNLGGVAKDTVVVIDLSTWLGVGVVMTLAILSALCLWVVCSKICAGNVRAKQYAQVHVDSEDFAESEADAINVE